MSMLGNRLRQARKKKGFTQEYVAEKIGVTYQTISNYERDERDPDTETLTKLANLLEVPVGWLVGQTDDPTPPQAKKEKPNYEEYVLSAKTLADAAIRISELNDKYDLNEKTFLELHTLAYKKYGLKSVKSADDAAHTKHNFPATGVFENGGDSK